MVCDFESVNGMNGPGGRERAYVALGHGSAQALSSLANGDLGGTLLSELGFDARKGTAHLLGLTVRNRQASAWTS